MSNAQAVIANLRDLQGFTKDEDGKEVLHNLTFEETCELITVASLDKRTDEQKARHDELNQKFQTGLNRYTYWRAGKK
jgi:hypothetical protein